MKTEKQNRRIAKSRRTQPAEMAHWGMISAGRAEALVARGPRQAVKVMLDRTSTTRSFALSILAALNVPASTQLQTSALWSEILSHNRSGRSPLLIVDGLENLYVAGEADRNLHAIRDSLKSLLLRGVPFACSGSVAGARFLFGDPQLGARFHRSVSPLGGRPT